MAVMPKHKGTSFLSNFGTRGFSVRLDSSNHWRPKARNPDVATPGRPLLLMPSMYFPIEKKFPNSQYKSQPNCGTDDVIFFFLFHLPLTDLKKKLCPLWFNLKFDPLGKKLAAINRSLGLRAAPQWKVQRKNSKKYQRVSNPAVHCEEQCQGSEYLKADE